MRGKAERRAAMRNKEGTRLDDLYRVFEFDRDLRLVMFRYFSMAEAVLKTVCSYDFTQVHVSEKEPYLDRRNYRSDRGYPERVDRLIRDFKSALGKDRENRLGGKRILITAEIITKRFLCGCFFDTRLLARHSSFLNFGMIL